MRTDTLLVVTVGYLLLPNAVFALGWLQPAWGYCVTLVVLACIVDAGSRARTDGPALAAPGWVAVAALAAFWVAFSGIGELNAQVSDYAKHNLVFHDLTVEPWPVIYRAGERGDPMLCYYLAYYLPPALVAKLAGLSHAAPASLAWGAAGVVLSFAWIARLGRPNGPAVLGLFTLVDGLCWTPGLVFLARRLVAGAGAPAGGWWQTDGFTERFWNLAGVHTRLVFQSEPSLLIWTPQHALAAWLATACVLSAVWERRSPRYVLLINAAVILWSPFVAVGLLPFSVAAAWRGGRPDLSWVDLVGGAALVVPVGLYFQAHEPHRYLGLLLGALPDATAWLKYVLFLLLAIGVLWAAVWLVQRRYSLLDTARWRAFCLAGVTLVVVTFVYMGKYNDWAMRVSMPALVVLHLTAATVAVRLWSSRASLRHRVAFAALILLAAVRTIKLYLLAPAGRLGAAGSRTAIATARDAGDGLVNLRVDGDSGFASQYLGSTESWFGRHLMKTAARNAPGALGSGSSSGRVR